MCFRPANEIKNSSNSKHVVRVNKLRLLMGVDKRVLEVLLLGNQKVKFMHICMGPVKITFLTKEIDGFELKNHNVH